MWKHIDTACKIWHLTLTRDKNIFGVLVNYTHDIRQPCKQAHHLAHHLLIESFSVIIFTAIVLYTGTQIFLVLEVRLGDYFPFGEKHLQSSSLSESLENKEDINK